MKTTLALPTRGSGRTARRLLAATAIGITGYLAFGAGLGAFHMPYDRAGFADLGTAIVAALVFAVIAPFQSDGGWFGRDFFLVFTGVLAAWIAVAYGALAVPVRGIAPRPRVLAAVAGIPLVAAFAGAVVAASGAFK